MCQSGSFDVKSTTRGKSNLWKWLLCKNVGKNEYKLYFCPMNYVFRYKKWARKTMSNQEVQLGNTVKIWIKPGFWAVLRVQNVTHK